MSRCAFHETPPSPMPPLLLLAAIVSAVFCTPAASLLLQDGERIVDKFPHVTAAFGPPHGQFTVKAPFVLALPYLACNPLNTSSNYREKVVLVGRGSCPFVDKVIHAQNAGAAAVIVTDNEISHGFVRMVANNRSQADIVTIPSVFVTFQTFSILSNAIHSLPRSQLIVNEEGELFSIEPSYDTSLRLVGIFALCLPFVWCVVVGVYVCERAFRARWEQAERGFRARSIPLIEYYEDTVDVHNHNCAICLEDFEQGTLIRALPCRHGFHTNCIDPWLSQRSDLCPICKRSIFSSNSPARWFWETFISSLHWRAPGYRAASVSDVDLQERSGLNV